MNEDNRFLTYALKYASLGYSVIPLQPKGKKPIISSWAEYQKQRADENQIREWWRQYPKANVGIVTGSISGIVVLDVDGEDGLSSLTRIGEKLRPTPISNTGNGHHYIYKHPGKEIRNFSRREPGLDLRGDGGYIVAPPSVHPSGREYEWSIDPFISSPVELPDWLLDLTKKKVSSGSTSEERIDPAKVLQGCPEGERDWTLFRYASRLRAKGYDRSEAETLVLQAAANCTPPFPEDEALKKVESAWRYDAGDGVEAETIIQSLMGQLEQGTLDPGAIYEPDVIGSLAVLKKNDPSQYAQTKTRLKSKLKQDINLNDLEKAVNQEIRNMQKLRVVDADEPAPPLEDILPDLPMKDLKKPYNWTLNENGIWQETRFGPICACPVPVLLTKRLQNVDTAEEKVEIAFYRDQQWRYIVADRSTIFNKTSLIQLADKGLPVSSESSKHLVRYLGDFERENLNQLPLCRSVGRMGWVGSQIFIPGAEGEIELDVDQGGTASIAGGYREEGSLEEWVSFIQQVRNFPIARFTLSASFAAPLLKLVNQRVFIIHNWGPSRGGKTASLKAALSVWGEPEEVMASFNATKVGLERLAAFYSDLPLGIDERQIMGDKQNFVESLVYLLGMGKGKARGAKSGGLQAFQTWRTIALTTGEEPLSTESSTAGIKTRALELYGSPIPDERTASEVHQGLSQNFGLAGPVFIQKLIQKLKDDPELFQTDYKAIQEKLSDLNPDNISSHLAAVSLVCMADYYASQWIFGLDEKESFTQCLDLAETIMGQLETVSETDDATRAYEYFKDWVLEKQSYFGEGENIDFYGWIEPGYIYVLGTRFDKTMKEGGFSPRRILQDWSERG